VDDSVLADRIRSTIGPSRKKQLHKSGINVTVDHGMSILHGYVEISRGRDPDRGSCKWHGQRPQHALAPSD
jgi:hypothetical protein